MNRGCIPALGACLLLIGPPGRGQEELPSEPEMPPPVSQAQKITLSQAVEQALRNNPLVAASTHQTASAYQNFVGQRASINPLLNITATTNTPGYLDPADPTKYGMLLTLETSGRQGLRSRQARAQFQGAQFDATTTRLTVRQAAMSAYADLQVANSTLGNARDSYEIARRLSDLTQKQFQLGAAPESNAIRAQIARTQAEQSLLRAVSDVLTARANLDVQLGRTPTEQVDAADPLAYAPITVDLEELQRRAAEARPEIRSAEASRRALQQAVGLQHAQYYPDLVVGANPKAVREKQVLLGLVLPLMDFGSIRSQVRRAEEDVRTQEAQVKQARQTVRLDVQSAYIALLRAQRLVESSQSGILPRAESLLKKVEQGYKLGASTILDLIDAQQTYRSTRSDYYSAIGDHRRALAQLERAIGGPLATPPARGGKTP